MIDGEKTFQAPNSLGILYRKDLQKQDTNKE